MAPINQPTPALAAWHSRWAKNRAFVEGEDAVKGAGELHLPKVRADDSQAEYEAHKDRTNFYPATTKIAQGILGLLFRKRPQLGTSSARVEKLSQLITAEGQSLDDLAEWCVRETLITNFTGLLVDHPDASGFTGLSAANADRLGYRPRIAGYIGESILEAKRGFLLDGSVGLVHVRLLEGDGKAVRQLLINDAGQYEAVEHRKVGDVFVEVSRVIPRRNGAPLDHIPFVLVSTSDKISPEPALLQHCVDLNLQHYRASGTRAETEHLTSGPRTYVTGYVPETDLATGKPVQMQWDVAPGAVWVFPSTDVKVTSETFDPKGAALNSETLKNLKQDLSTLGHSILAPEKEAPEAPESHVLRRAAENASLAAFTRAVSRKLEKAVLEFALWADPAVASLTYSLNLDFHPQTLTPQEHKELRDDYLAGVITLETYQLALRDGEVLSPAFDPAIEREKLALEAVDRPPVL